LIFPGHLLGAIRWGTPAEQLCCDRRPGNYPLELRLLFLVSFAFPLPLVWVTVLLFFISPYDDLSPLSFVSVRLGYFSPVLRVFAFSRSVIPSFLSPLGDIFLYPILSQKETEPLNFPPTEGFPPLILFSSSYCDPISRGFFFDGSSSLVKRDYEFASGGFSD